MSERIRCAVYTRKSTEEGLKQDFNSLDAQREACEAYIKSQKGLGWTVVQNRYDDGGISGGTMERPALKELLADIDNGRVDLVVVYKVDRLTRSLIDFSRIIETFDARNVSFVSVTQQFNTASSMGRLTLNVLLSFAQFEREVTAERIRDKIAASKKKGIWMGGLAPLGYDARDRKLVVNDVEAKTVRDLYDLYLKLGSIRELKCEADRRGIRTKVRTINEQQKGGRPFTRGHLQQLLRNPVYSGYIAHRGQVFEGKHTAIVTQKVWKAVQEMLDGKSPARMSSTTRQSRSLLAGLLFDEAGDRLTPTHANKKGRAYHYYVSSRLVSGAKGDATGWRLPRADLDRAILDLIDEFLNGDDVSILAIDAATCSPAEIERARDRIHEMASCLKFTRDNQCEILKQLVERIIIAPGSLSITIKTSAFSSVNESTERKHEIVAPFQMKRRGVETKIILGTSSKAVQLPDQNLIELVANTRMWFGKIADGQISEVRELAKETGMDLGDISRFMPLALLAPGIIEAIVEGLQPLELTMETLKRTRNLPMDWQKQRELLGFT